MKSPRPAIRKTILNQSAEAYLFIILLSFAGSVALTRLLLELTGYPQLGTGDLHIAHVLWGGLLLFISVLLLLIFANRWIYSISAAISGIGVGLFIDEVGKFITQDNNYFYPSAAPIIYAIFLLTVLVFLLVRKPRYQDERANLYYVLQDLEEVADHDLSETEKERIQIRLQTIILQNPDTDLARLARDLLKFIQGKHIYVTPHRSTLFEKIKQHWLNFEQHWLGRNKFKRLLILGQGLWGAFLLIVPILILFISSTPKQMEELLISLSQNELIRNPSGLNWFEARIGLESAVGLLLCLSALIWIIGKDRQAAVISTVILMLSLTVINLLVFYFDQFSAIITSLPQFLLLIGTLRYRQRFLNPNVAIPVKSPKIETQ